MGPCFKEPCSTDLASAPSFRNVFLPTHTHMHIHNVQLNLREYLAQEPQN
jgi:hypothetical protein